jgi:S-ribosylhomocysteine lyase LuxS involved in autoinducer biosynthesis
MHSLKSAQKIAKDILRRGIDIMDNKKLFLSEKKMKKLGL